MCARLCARVCCSMTFFCQLASLGTHAHMLSHVSFAMPSAAKGCKPSSRREPCAVKEAVVAIRASNRREHMGLRNHTVRFGGVSRSAFSSEIKHIIFMLAKRRLNCSGAYHSSTSQQGCLILQETIFQDKLQEELQSNDKHDVVFT